VDAPTVSSTSFASSGAAGAPASGGNWHSGGTSMPYSLAAFRPRIFFLVAVVTRG